MLYNVTIKIESQHRDRWLAWMKDMHIPAMMATHCFQSFMLNKIVGDDDEHGVGYAIQFVSQNREAFDTYLMYHANRLQNEHQEMWKNKYVAFRTLMEVESEG